MGAVTAACEGYCELLFPLKGEHSTSQRCTCGRTVNSQIHSVHRTLRSKNAMEARKVETGSRGLVPLKDALVGGLLLPP